MVSQLQQNGLSGGSWSIAGVFCHQIGKNYLDLFCREKNMAKPNIELMTVRDIPILVGYEVMLGYIS